MWDLSSNNSYSLCFHDVIKFEWFVCLICYEAHRCACMLCWQNCLFGQYSYIYHLVLPLTWWGCICCIYKSVTLSRLFSTLKLLTVMSSHGQADNQSNQSKSDGEINQLQLTCSAQMKFPMIPKLLWSPKCFQYYCRFPSLNTDFLLEVTKQLQLLILQSNRTSLCLTMQQK